MAPRRAQQSKTSRPARRCRSNVSSRARHAPVRHRRVGAARRAHRPRRPRRVRAAGRRVPQELVAERDQHRRPEVLPRAARLARARELGQADDRPRRRHDHRLGPRRRLLRRAKQDARRSTHELTHILLHQLAAFNSPVWFNVGFEECPQCSACLPHHALVSTPAGMVPIGELVENEQVGARSMTRAEPRDRRASRTTAASRSGGCAAQRQLRRSHCRPRREGRRRAPHAAASGCASTSSSRGCGCTCTPTAPRSPIRSRGGQ